jgi:dTDP-4-amino-4,6-dideoxygalactose transaminase
MTPDGTMDGRTVDPQDDFLMFHRPSLGEEEERAVVAVLRSGWITTGPKTKQFEREFAQFRGVRHAVGVNSCTAALHLALVCLEAGPGDEVITSPITFASSANVIVHTGATPVFCDVQPDTLNLDPECLPALITPHTKAIIAVHFAGHPCDMDEILAAAHRPDGSPVPVIEDAAHTIEAEYRGRPAGSLGRCAAFSFYATKNMTTGEGGMLVTDDGELAERAAVLALHGISRDAWKRYAAGAYRHWEIVAAGFKYNMFDIQAAIGLEQLKKIERFWESRRRLSLLYDEALGGVPGLRLPARRPYVRHSYHLYPVRVTGEVRLSRDELIAALNERGIGVGVHFRAVHLHEFYREALGFAPGICPVAEEAGESLLSLPLFPDMREEDVGRVAQSMRTALT